MSKEGRIRIAAETAGMEPGDSVRIQCPECGGGTSGERSMSVRVADDGAVLFLCYRASCGARGVLGGSPSKLVSLVSTKQPTHKVKPDPTSRLVLTLDLPYEYFGTMYDPDTNRVAFPVLSPSGTRRGWVLRSYDNAVTPKVLTVPTSPEVQLGWNRVQGTQVVVVEDIPSAAWLETVGVRAVALQGTHASSEAIDEIVEEAEEVVWALDADAFSKAQKWDAATKIHFRRSAVLLLTKDIKDQTREELITCLQEISWLRVYAPEKPTSE